MELNIDTGVEEFPRQRARACCALTRQTRTSTTAFLRRAQTLERVRRRPDEGAGGAVDGDEQQPAPRRGCALLNEYDGKIKKLLTGIFGAENDFDAILGGVNLAGVGANGKRVVQNLLEALTPILREGAERRLTAAADAATARGRCRPRRARGAV